MSCAEMTSKVGVAHKISRALTCAVYLAPPTVNPGSAPVKGGVYSREYGNQLQIYCLGLFVVVYKHVMLQHQRK